MDKVEAKTQEIMAMDPTISPKRAQIKAMKVIAADQLAAYHRQVMDQN
ncbi:hypothetical protein ACFYL6_20955 [Micromonospora sp. NPDC007208]